MPGTAITADNIFRVSSNTDSPFGGSPRALTLNHPDGVCAEDRSGDGGDAGQASAVEANRSSYSPLSIFRLNARGSSPSIVTPSDVQVPTISFAAFFRS